MGPIGDNRESQNAGGRSAPGFKAVLRWCHAKFVLSLLTAGAVIAVLYFFPPQHSSFYPRCLLHQWTDWRCPGCGGLRAAHELLHGRVAEAFRLNSLLILLLPLAGIYASTRAWQAFTGRQRLQWISKPIVVWLLVLAAIVFAIARNLALTQ